MYSPDTFHKETHNFVATAVDETLATFGANLSENFKVLIILNAKSFIE